MLGTGYFLGLILCKKIIMSLNPTPIWASQLKKKKKKKTSLKLKMLGPLCNQTLNLKTDSKTWYILQYTEIKIILL